MRSVRLERNLICFLTHTDSMRDEKIAKLQKILKGIGIVIGVCLGVCLLLWLTPFFIAFLIAELLAPIVEKRKRTGKRRTVRCIMISVLFWLLLLVIMGGIVSIGIYGIQRLMEWGQQLQRRYGSIQNWCYRNWKELWKGMEALVGHRIQSCHECFMQGYREICGRWNVNKMAGVLCVCGKKSMEWIAKLFVTIVAQIFFLIDRSKIQDYAKKWEKTRIISDAFKRMRLAVIIYLKAQVRILAIVILVCTCGFVATGQGPAILLGIGIGLFDALPFLGTGAILIPWGILCILRKQVVCGMVYLVVYLICTILRNVLEPRWMGKGLSIPPLLMMLSVYVGILLGKAAGVIIGPAVLLLLWEIFCAQRQEKRDQ